MRENSHLSRSTSLRRAVLLAASLASATVAAPTQATPEPNSTSAELLSDYRLLRSLAVDLLGRIPTDAELDSFEGHSDRKKWLEGWIEQNLQGPGYAARLTRVYADLLRPQFGAFGPAATRQGLARVLIQDPDGRSIWVYYRPAQRRVRLAEAPRDPRDPEYARYANLRSGFCLLEEETGVAVTATTQTGVARPVDAEVFTRHITVVRPWWLFADYRAESPVERYDATSWATRFPGFVLGNDLLKEPDGKTDTYDIYVCAEETGTNDMGPMDSDPTKEVSCATGYGVTQSSSCGCGTGLEHCMPGASVNAQGPRPVFQSSRNVMLGVDDPTDLVNFDFRGWQALWMFQEPQVYLHNLFANNSDFRLAVTGRSTFVNGPLSQFYALSARANSNDAVATLPLLPDRAALPKDLLPFEVMRWEEVKDRGEKSAGVLTMPLFLYKNATRRARAHVVYNVFLCRDFIAPTGLTLAPGKEPNLMKRDGCAACHQTLDPLAAYFARVPEADWSWLPQDLYPTLNPACKLVNGRAPAGCAARYDDAFATTEHGQLRGAYGGLAYVDEGPQGLGKALAQRPEFGRCVAENVAKSFLGRDLYREDDGLLEAMTAALTLEEYRPRSMVRVLLRSQAYRSANNLSSSSWRKGGTP